MKKKMRQSTTVSTVPALVSGRTGMDKESLLKDLKNYSIPGISEAARLFWQLKDYPVYLYTDYDVDGITSACIFRLIARALSIPIRITVPRRFSDGYGINAEYVGKLPKGKGLLITADNGIAAIEALRLAKEKGLSIIVLDHHLPAVSEEGSPMLPEVDVLVDPHVTGGDFTDYCGAGLVFCFLRYILDYLPHGLSKDEVVDIKRKAVSFAAIGTIGDCVSLTGENRRIVKDGLACISAQACTSGLAAVLDSLWLNCKVLSSDVAYKLAPCINAWGRLNDKGSLVVYRILSYDGKRTVRLKEAAGRMKSENDNRKLLAAECEQRAKSAVCGNESCIVLYDPACPPGIAGIAAGRLAEDYHVPAIVLTDEKAGIIKGSGRSVSGIDLKALLDKVSGMLFTYGGHPEACGLSLSMDNFADFRDSLKKLTPERRSGIDDTVLYDIMSTYSQIPALYRQILMYGPYGEGNPEITVRIDGMKFDMDDNGLVRFKELGNGHLKLTSGDLEVLWFGGLDEWKAIGSPGIANVIGVLSQSTFKGTTRISMQICYMEPGL